MHTLSGDIEPEISSIKRPQTYTLDSKTTGNGVCMFTDTSSFIKIYILLNVSAIFQQLYHTKKRKILYVGLWKIWI